MTDGELLKAYVVDRSETAFGELLRRHINLVYSAALRQMNGDAHLAEDVTQSVFAELARKAARLTAHTSLVGWLYTCTRFVAANLRRAEHRRQVREQQAHAMNAVLTAPGPEPDWKQIRPLLDDAMHLLDERDREAVLLRHFENCSYAEIGAFLGLTENAARMRVERALEKLRGALTKQGVASTAVVLAGLLAANAAGAVPAYLAAKVLNHALAAATTATGGLSALQAYLAASKIKLAAAVIIATAAVALVVTARHTASTRSKNLVAALVPANPVTQNLPADIPSTNPAAVAAAAAPLPDGPVLHLQIVDGDQNIPVPDVPIDYRGWAGGKFENKKLQSDRLGNCDVPYPSNITYLELTTRKEYFADTRLLWQPPHGDVIPTNYLLRLDRGITIGGHVVDADGNPVPGAKVGWNHQDDPAVLKLPQSHEFGWIEVTTGNDGRWQITRIAEDMLPRIYGSARDSNYVDSPLVFIGKDAAQEKQLRDGTLTFHLGRAMTLTGIVVDPNGAPVAGAKILIGQVSESGRREGTTQSDGTFSISGCQPGKLLVSADAKGYAVTTVEADLSTNSQPIQLKLQPGKTVRLRVVDKEGHPIAKAQLWLNPFERGMPDPNRPKPVQVDLSLDTDDEGRAVWTNAPDADLDFDASASGYLRVSDVRVRPDGQEHVITMPWALVVHGLVLDGTTGQPVPHFRIATGWPETNSGTGVIEPHWISIGRFWLDFNGGAYSNAFEEPVRGGAQNPGYVLKFTADGYAPYVSRVINPDERDLKLDVTLNRATARIVTVFTPGHQPAVNTDVGLVFPGAHLQLRPGGFARDNVETGGALLRTDANGTFALPPDDTVSRVIVAGPGGYAEFVPSALPDDGVIFLQAWGQLQVNCVSAGRPAAGRQFQLLLGDSPDRVPFNFQSSLMTTDEHGQFLVSQLPPGTHQLARVFPQPQMNNVTGWTQGEKIPFEIRSGETTTLTVGASNYTVTARLQWPAGVTRQPQWQIQAAVQTPMPEFPPELQTNEAARIAYFQTDELKALRARFHHYEAALNDDGTLSADDVPAGDYTFRASVIGFPAGDTPTTSKVRMLYTATASVTIPADPPSGTLDLGSIELQPAPDRP